MATRANLLFACIGGFLAVVGTPLVALAQGPAVVTCVPEIRTWCSVPNRVAREACIKTNFRNFSLDCQIALVKAAALTKYCHVDFKKNCRDVLPGGGRNEACLRENFEKLSEPCKATILRAAAKN